MLWHTAQHKAMLICLCLCTVVACLALWPCLVGPQLIKHLCAALSLLLLSRQQYGLGVQQFFVSLLRRR
jgi:hypothetical protein